MSDRAEEQGGSARDTGPSAGRAPAAIRLTLEARGIVQGVGFRPFVAREARALGLRGTVCNTAYGARVEAGEGTAVDVYAGMRVPADEELKTQGDCARF